MSDPTLTGDSARARLIAAAPDMLAALNEIADRLSKIDAGDPTTETGWADPTLCDLWMRARDAIAKAAQ